MGLEARTFRFVEQTAGSKKIPREQEGAQQQTREADLTFLARTSRLCVFSCSGAICAIDGKIRIVLWWSAAHGQGRHCIVLVTSMDFLQGWSFVYSLCFKQNPMWNVEWFENQCNIWCTQIQMIFFLSYCYRAKLHDLSICLELFLLQGSLISHGLQICGTNCRTLCFFILIHWPYFERNLSVHFFLTFPSYILYFNALAC